MVDRAGEPHHPILGIIDGSMPGLAGDNLETRGDFTLLRRLGCAAWVLRADGSVHYANTAADRLIGESRELWRDSARLRFRDDSLDLLWQRAIARARSGRSPSGLKFRAGAAEADVMICHLGSACSAAPIAGACELLVLLTLKMPRVNLPIAVRLTPAEERVLQLALRATPGAEIARTLDLSANTVKTHMKRIYHKLGVRRRGELLLRSLEMGASS